MIKNVFILANDKIKGIEKERNRIEGLLKKCGKTVHNSSEGVDLIITMGGDGTFLKGIHLAGGADVPIYGLKYGNVGFLVNSVRDLDSKLKKVISGDFRCHKRMLLDITIKREKGRPIKDFCLNEAVIFRKGIRIIDMTVSGAKEDFFGKIRGDGLVAATPTGSTAHSLSAFGPVISPELECILIVPFSPHTLSWRPVVASPKEKITVRIAPEAILTVDGQRAFDICGTDKLLIKKSSKTARIIFDDNSFFGKMKTKFNWGM